MITTRSSRLLSLFSAVAILAVLPSLHAQNTGTEKPKPAANANEIPADINGRRTIIPSPVAPKPYRLAIYKGQGSGDPGIDNVAARARQVPGATVTLLTGEQIVKGELTLERFDAVAFTGGLGKKQAEGIGDEGREKVREFVEKGGGYLGICAGSYLAAKSSWGLGIINAKTVSPKWNRGRAFLDLEVAPDGVPITGSVKNTFKCRYANGPILQPAGAADLPEYKVAAFFRSEVANNGAPAGIQVGAPAALYSTFGKGRVFLLSPHPENTPGLENFVPRALLWLTAK